MEKKQAIDAFAALSQETRLEVFRLLIRTGSEGLLAGEIGDALCVKQNTMSANLNILSRSGLIRNRREGRGIRYFADIEGVQVLLQFLMQDCCGGRQDLCQPIFDPLACVC